MKTILTLTLTYNNYTVFVFLLCTKSDIIYFALNEIFNKLDEFRAFCGSDHTQWSHANKSKHTQNMRREGEQYD